MISPMKTPLRGIASLWLLAGSFVLIGTAGIIVGCAAKHKPPAPAAEVDPPDAPGAPRGIGLYVQAVQAYQKGDTAAAINRLERATRKNPDLRMAHSMLGDLYRSQGNLEQAATQYQETTRLDPYASNNQYRLGLTYQLMNRLKDAAAAYLRAIEIDPNNVQANVNLGLVYLALDQIPDSLKYLRKATQIDPSSAAAWANLGAALDVGGDAEGAERAYKKSLELNGLQDSTLLNLGFNLIGQRKATEAVSVMEQVVKRMDKPVTRRAYGDALVLAGRFDEAIQQYDLALKQDPRYYPALNAKGDALARKYQKGLELDDTVRVAAIEAWKQSLAVNPQQPRIETLIKQWTGSNRIFGAK
jgi:tetratricopeptide (TPR) repeat protein